MFACTHGSSLVDWSHVDVEDLHLRIYGCDFDHGTRSVIEMLNLLPSHRLQKLRLSTGLTDPSMDDLRTSLGRFKDIDDVFVRRQFKLLQEVHVKVSVDYAGDSLTIPHHDPCLRFSL